MQLSIVLTDEELLNPKVRATLTALANIGLVGSGTYQFVKSDETLLTSADASQALGNPMGAGPAPTGQATPNQMQTGQTFTAPASAQPSAAPAPSAAPPSGVPTAATTYTLEQLAVAGTQLIDAGRQGELHQVLAQFGVQALTQLPKEHYGAFATQLRQLGAKI